MSIKLWIIALCAALFVYRTDALLHTEIIQGHLDETTSVMVNKSIEYIIDYFDTNGTLKIAYPLRINVQSEESLSASPVIVVVRLKKQVLSWELPLIVEDDSGKKQKYKYSARTLCNDGAGGLYNHSQLYYAAIDDHPIVHAIQSPYITISTMSETNVTAKVNLSSQEDFYVKESIEYKATISPSTPVYYYYAFRSNDSDGMNHITLKVLSEDDICMTVSIQNYSCPVMDLNDDITFRGIWQTVSRRGGIMIPKWKFPNGMYIVFAVRGETEICNGGPSPYNIDRLKTVRFSITSGIAFDGYFNAVIITVACILCFYMVFGVCLLMYNRAYYVPRTMQYVPADTPTPSTAREFADTLSNDSFDTVDETESDADIVLTKSRIYVSDLSRRHQSALIKKSSTYFWHVLIVALFYFLPVIQLVITYQRVLNDTGNQDTCYYNFLCAHPLGLFSDFNHIFSNIGYVTLGLLFMLITYGRERWHEDVMFDQNFGVPKHYGLFYALGFALVAEGILSGSYHVCPNYMNFQFDTSFMYITAVLCMIKIYHTRHPDINANAYSTFGVLAVAILLGMIGILEPSLAFWICFTVLHLLLCVYLTFKIYYLGRCKFDSNTIRRAWNVIAQNYSAGILHLFTPIHTSRMVLLVIGNLLNWAMAAYGIYSQAVFAEYLLGLFLLNTVYYFAFYIVMKLLHKESITRLTVIFLVLSLTCAVASMYCFLNKSISWSKTPAQSRTYNQECRLLDFYDFHDIWHFLSAIGMFFMFMVLLTMDDDLSHKPRTEIPAF